MKIFAKQLLTPEGWREGLTLTAEGGRITALEENVPGEISVAALIPGLFDSHIHGGCGFDTCAATGEGLDGFLMTMARQGVTDALLTLSTASEEALRQGLCFIRQVMEEQRRGLHPGTRIRGAHMEGPYVSRKRSGAMRKELMQQPGAESFERICGENGDIVRLITVAPELEGAADFAAYARARGIVVQAGHSDADFEQGQAAFREGFSSLCHTFNAARPIHHREPSLITAALLDENVYCEAICDLKHLHPAILRLIYRCKGREKMLMVSDSTMPNGLPDGEYFATNHPVTVRDGVARTPEGNLSGGTCFLGESVKKLVGLGFPAEDVLRMASQTPADRLGLSSMGRLAVGAEDHMVGLEQDGTPVFLLMDGQMLTL